MYEIPQQLEYQEKIVFGLTFKQLAYAFGFFPIIFFFIFKLNTNIALRVFLAMYPTALAVGFMFFDLEGKLKMWIKWYKLRNPIKEDLEKFFDIKKIEDDLIITKNKELAVLKVEPINFHIKHEKEQETIILAFQKFLNSLDFPIQILMTTEELKIDKYIKPIINKDYSKIIKENQKHLTKIINDKKALNRNFYLVIPKTTDISIQLEICENRLYSIGLKTKRLRNFELIKLLKNLLICKDQDGFIPNQVVNNPSSIEINEKLNRTIHVHGYPRMVESGFLDRIISSLGEFDLSLHIEPCSLEGTMILLNKEIQKQRADLYAAKIKNQLNPSLEIKYKDTLKILENLQKGNEKLFNISLYVNCKANTKKELDFITKKVQSELNSILIIPKESTFSMLQGVKSCLPLIENTLKVKRNIPTKALSAFFPFTSSFFKFDKTGVFFGLNKNSIPIIRDVFKLSNANGVCLASSGAGKSYMAKLFISRYVLNGTKTMIIDPQGEYKSLVKQFKGQIVDLGRDSDTMINPLDLMGHSYPEKRLALMDIMPIMLGDLTEPQKSFMDKALTEAYERKNIFMDDPETWGNQPPILEDVLINLKKIEKEVSSMEKMILRSIINRLDMYVSGVFSFLNKRTNINFSNNFVSFDIGNLPKQVKPTMMFLILEYVYSKMRENLERKLLVIDEAWSLLGKTNEASYIFEIVKTCRKYNLGLFLINQEVEDMLNSKAGKSVLANSSYTILLKQKPSVMDAIQKTFYLSNTERNTLLTSLVGEGIIIMEDEHSNLKVIASKQEHELITTNADELLKNNKGKNKPKSKIKKRKSTIDIKFDSKQKLYKYDDLSEEEIKYLSKKRFKEYSGYSIVNNKKEKYLIKTRNKESPQHCFLVFDILNFIKKFTNKVWLYETVKPDIVFEVNKKKYVIEVETGKTLKNNKKQLLEKIKVLNEEYGKRWFFVVTAKKLASKYNNLGKTHDKRTVKNILYRILRNS
ncbi:MAG: ATP-binding protein [Nanoarchaeota archaeon]|nr:ATP-binding protein [Nanoarchaeota archaeon]MBU1027837.1 ATP-binding protein [Nanoarchaeota archaeon]